MDGDCPLDAEGTKRMILLAGSLARMVPELISDGMVEINKAFFEAGKNGVTFSEHVKSIENFGDDAPSFKAMVHAMDALSNVMVLMANSISLDFLARLSQKEEATKDSKPKTTTEDLNKFSGNRSAN